MVSTILTLVLGTCQNSETYPFERYVTNIKIDITVNDIFRPKAIKKWTRRFKLAIIWKTISVKMNQMKNIGKNLLKKEKKFLTIHSKKIVPFVNLFKEMIEVYFIELIGLWLVFNSRPDQFWFNYVDHFKVRTAEYDEIQETLEEIAKENTLLKEKAKQADVLTEVLQELVGETEWDSPKMLFFICNPYSMSKSTISFSIHLFTYDCAFYEKVVISPSQIFVMFQIAWLNLRSLTVRLGSLHGFWENSE